MMNKKKIYAFLFQLTGDKYWNCFVEGIFIITLNIVPLFLYQLSVTDFSRFADIYGTDEEEDSFSNIKVELASDLLCIANEVFQCYCHGSLPLFYAIS